MSETRAKFKVKNITENGACQTYTDMHAKNKRYLSVSDVK